MPTDGFAVVQLGVLRKTLRFDARLFPAYFGRIGMALVALDYIGQGASGGPSNLGLTLFHLGSRVGSGLA